MFNHGLIGLCVAAYLCASFVTIVTGDCPFPKRKIANAVVIYQAPHHVNLTIARENYLLRFRCSPGYTLSGSKAIVCLSNKWTDRLPSCIKMKCVDPPAVQNGHFTLKSGIGDELIIGSTATYTCDDGYELENTSDSVLTCHLFTNINDVQWKGAIPKCIRKVTCPDPGVSNDGARSGNCCFVGDVLEFSCNDDFELVGNNEIQCLPGGSWSSSRPLCRPLGDHCDFPPPIPNGAIVDEKTSDYFLPYDMVEIVCKPGYKYTGSIDFISCEEENVWEEEFEECIEAFCDPPKLLANGTIPEIESSNITSYPYNFELTYICNEGFRLIGDSWRYCDSRGWSGKAPHCEEIRCPDPGIPEYGTRIGNNFNIGEKVVFKCFMGFHLIGSFERYCTNNGKWSDELARCNHPNNYCPNPGIPVNGMKNSSNYEMGDIISFNCHNGYTLIGSANRECLPSREWSGNEAQCIGPYDFDNKVKVSEILKEAIEERKKEQARKLKEYHDALFATFHNGTGPVGRALDLNFPGRLVFYFAFDVSGSVKANNFRKSVEFAKAIVKKVGISKDGAAAGAITFSSTAHLEFLPLRYEKTEDVLTAFDKLNYTGGGTAATSALTLIRENLIDLTRAVLAKRGQKSIKSIIFILTDGKANMGGDPQHEAKKLKEAGVEIYCVGITNSVMQNSLFRIASDPKEEHVFILQNYDTLSYLIEEITNGTVDYSKCGLGIDKLGGISRGRVVAGNEAVDPWPWMAALYLKKNGQNGELSCGGTIIHESYILTAAHCFYKLNGDAIEAKDVIVKLGITNVNNISSMDEFEVKRLIMHPQYRQGNYDYDVALLQLKRRAEFSALIRPICLPPAELPVNTSLYKPGEYGLATGWGHTGKVQKNEMMNLDMKMSDNLKEVVLPIQPIENCARNVVDNRLLPESFTDRMFCAGDGNGGNDTCLGDSGGPLMQSQLNKDGYTYWTQVGIISWGEGCGLANTYGYYSHVHKLLDWVLTNTQSKN